MKLREVFKYYFKFILHISILKNIIIRWLVLWKRLVNSFYENNWIIIIFFYTKIWILIIHVKNWFIYVKKWLINAKIWFFIISFNTKNQWIIIFHGKKQLINIKIIIRIRAKNKWIIIFFGKNQLINIKIILRVHAKNKWIIIFFGKNQLINIKNWFLFIRVCAKN